MYCYQVFRKGDKFAVVREDGRVICFRKRCSHAEQVAELLDLGKPYPKEIQQVLADKSDMKIEVREDAKLPYKIVDSYGVIVRSFKHEYLAKWWLDDYKLKVKIARDKSRNSQQENAEPVVNT